MLKRLTAILVCATAVSGCATQIIGTLTLGNISSIAGIASTLATGRDLGELALSLAMGQDCRFSEAFMREDRDMCEDYGSPATKDDFQGLLIAGRDAEGNVVRAAPMVMAATSDYDNGDRRDIEAEWADIRRGQEEQYAAAEVRVAARTEQATIALAAFMAPAPGAVVAPDPVGVASLETAPIVVARLEGERGLARPETIAAITPRAKPADLDRGAEVILTLNRLLGPDAPRASAPPAAAAVALGGFVLPRAKPAFIAASAPAPAPEWAHAETTEN